MTSFRTLLLAGCLFGLGCGRGSESPSAGERPSASAPKETAAHADAGIVTIDPTMLRDLRITTTAVEARSGSEDAQLLGELAVDERAYAEVGVPVPARVTRLLAGPGNAVREGQPLVELQSPEVARSRSEYVSAEARLALAERALQRKRELAAERIAPMREVQEAEAAASEARAALRSASAALTTLGLTVPSADDDVREAAAFTLRSPIAGTVIERRVVRGQMLEPATAAFRIANLSTLWLNVHAFERDAVRIVSGAPAKLTFPALPGETFRGVVTLIGREVARESRTVPVRIDVPNRRGLLRPGMSATAAVPVGASAGRVLTVPIAAVQRVREEWCVFVPKDASTYEIRKIGRGRDLGAEVEVLSGLTAGERIVVDGAFLLKAQAEKGEGGHGQGGRP